MNIRGQAFKDFIFAMQGTGCRPSEVARVTATDVNLEAGTWTLVKHQTARKTGTPSAAESASSARSCHT